MRRVAFLIAVLAVLTLPALALATASPPVQSGPGSEQQTGVGVTMVDYAFSPAYIAVPVGGTVTWYNAGVAPHTASADSGFFDTGTLGSGGAASITFWTPGVYGYHCAIHPGMVGTVQVS